MNVVGEGRGWIAVDKPAGVVVVPARDEDPEHCLKRIVERERDEPLWVVHRLDRGTSGVVLFARSAEAHRTLCMAFERGRVEKIYLAVVSPAPARDSGTIDVPLHAARRGRMRPSAPGEPGARPSRTDWRVLRREGDRALLEVHPRTGRQHQIRVHLRWAGMPLLVDPVYGGREGEGRLTLHAWRLRFEDPDGGGAAEVSAEAPESFATLSTSAPTGSPSRGRSSR